MTRHNAREIPVTPASHSVALLVGEIRERHKLREDFHRAEKRLTLQIKAVCRRIVAGDEKTNKARSQVLYKRIESAMKGGPIDPEVKAFATHFQTLWDSREWLREVRLEHEKRVEDLARQLPVWPWVKGVTGFGPLGLGQIVGECGDLAGYANPAKLWKRMGVAVIDGERQRRVKDVEQAAIHGYSPTRRSVLWSIADAMTRKVDNPYRDLYLQRKIGQAEKHPDRSKGHIDNDARRYVSKRLLRDLWRAWRDAPQSLDARGSGDAQN